MAGYDGSIRINTKLLTKEFDRDANHLKDSLTKLGGSINRLMGALGVAIGVAGLVKLGKQAIETASDIQEVQNVVDTAFGDMAYKMEQFADTAVKQFGMSRLSAKEMGSTFMAMGASMVDSMEDASDMAISLTGRAADMASFYNKTAEETATSLKSIYTGETETLKTYGVVMTEINLQEYAAEKGIRKKISAMTQAEKVQLRYNYVMEQTSLAAGDFAKTSDSWANQTRILSETFKELLSVIGTGLIPVFTPIVKSLNTILTQLIAIASQAGAVMSKLFGVSIPVADTKKFSQDMSAAAGGAGELADGVEEAGKEAKKALAPFDDLVVLADKAGGSGKGTGAGAGGGFEVPKLDMKDVEATPVEEKFIQMAETIRNVMSDLFAPLKTAWENQGQFVMDSWRYALEQIGLLAVSVGSDFMEVWKQPETTAILENILIIIGDIGLIAGNLAERFRTAWEENDVGLRILENIRDIYADIIERIRNIADATVEWTKTLDFSPLLESVNTLLEAIEPLADNIGAGLEWFYKNVLLPLAGWTIEDAIPAFLDGLSGAVSALDGIIVAFTPTGEWLWNDFLKPMGEFAGDVFVASMEAIGEALKAFGDWIADNQDAVSAFVAVLVAFFDIALIAKITDMGLALAAYIINAGGLAAVLHTLTASLAANTAAWWANISAKLADKLETIEIIALYAKDFAVKLAQGTAELVKQAAQFAINTAAKIADTAAQIAMTAATAAWNVVCAVATAATTAFGAAVAFLTSPIGLVVLAIGAIIAVIALCIIYWEEIQAVMTSVGEACAEIWEGFKQTLSDIWGGIRLMFEGVIQFLTGVFTGNWQKAWDGVTKIFEGVKNTLKGIINGILGLVEGMANGVVRAINAMIRALNALKFDFPDWVPGMGGKSFGLNLSELSEVKIPRLATGAVIRGGNPFIAMLGDQPRGKTNIEAPADLIKDMARQGIREELSGLSLGGGSANQIISLNVDGQEFARLTLGDFFSEMHRQGYNVEVLGVT